jgi:HEAT repeat protein
MKKPWLTIGLIAFLSALIVIALVPVLTGPTEPEYHGKKLSAWVQDLNSPSPLTQANAKLAIQQMGTNAVPFLVQMLHVKDSPLKRKCMDLMARQHWVHLHFHYDFEKHGDAFRALATLGPDAKSAIPDLADLLKEAQGLEVAYTLAQIGPTSLPALENALTSSNGEAGMNAAQGLARLGDPSSIANLLAALKDPDPGTRYMVVTALVRFPGQANVIVPALTNYLDDPDSMVVGNVARTLGSFGAKARPAFPEVLKMVGGTNYDAGEAATEALMNIDFDRALATFTNNLQSSDVNVRRTAAWALMFFGPDGEPAVPILVNSLNDPDAKVRDQAAAALWRIGADPDLVVPALIESLNDTNAEVRETAAIALGGYGGRAKFAVPQILKAIEANKGHEETLFRLHMALSVIDPQAAAKLGGH